MRRWVLILGLIWLMVSNPESTFACSGGYSYPRIDLLENFELLVDATVVEVDDSGWNAVLEVHRYLKGDGPHYLSVSDETLGEYNSRYIRRYDLSCYFPRPLWEEGVRAFIGLGMNIRQNGTFQNGILFPIERGYTTYFDYEFGEFGEFASVPVETFEDLLLSASELEEPVESPLDRQYPLMRMFRVTAESGMQAIVQYDRQIRVIDPYKEAFAISSDGAHAAYRNSDDEIYFREYQIIDGKELVFSPDSSFMAAWGETELTLYRFDNGGKSDRDLPAMRVLPSGQTEFTDIRPARERTVVWSGNSSTIAYLDEAGIWIWNLYYDAAPQLVVSREEIESDFVFSDVSLFDLSLTGRYLRYGTPSNWHLRDLDDESIKANALVSPDESHFAYVMPDLEEPESPPDCTIPIDQSCPIIVRQSNDLLLHYWRNAELVVMTCDDAYCGDRTYPADISQSYELYRYRNGWHVPLLVRAVYDELFDTTAWQLDDYQVQINYVSTVDIPAIEFWEPLVFDFSGILDSPIRSIEWDQPLFFNTD